MSNACECGHTREWHGMYGCPKPRWAITWDGFYGLRVIFIPISAITSSIHTGRVDGPINWYTTEQEANNRMPNVMHALQGWYREICICAAVRAPDGLIFRGHRHFDAIRVAIENSATKRVTQDMQGFITSHNRFVSRAEGAELQRLAGVKSAATGLEVEEDTLTSEDLY